MTLTSWVEELWPGYEVEHIRVHDSMLDPWTTPCIDGCQEILTHSHVVEADPDSTFPDTFVAERTQHGPNHEHSREWPNKMLLPWTVTPVEVFGQGHQRWSTPLVDWLREIHGRQR